MNINTIDRQRTGEGSGFLRSIHETVNFPEKFGRSHYHPFSTPPNSENRELRRSDPRESGKGNSLSIVIGQLSIVPNI
ncbi:MAG: hypothetical protein ACP5D7_00240 [Limnospira sp.]